MHSWTSPASTSADLIRPLEWRDGAVRFIDQRTLPDREDVVTTSDPMVVVAAIRSLSLRGAPLIGIAAAYAAVLSARRAAASTPADRMNAFLADLAIIASARPTAVNLRWACDRMARAAQRTADLDHRAWVSALLAEARMIHQEDTEACENIARHGVAALPTDAVLLTICNTGALATGGIGTAFGIIRLAAERRMLRHLFICETRPLLQGSRLTAWEAVRLGLPATLHTDSMAASLMRDRGVNAVVVGADRIAANGDTANKVGTYALAVLAKAHGIPLYVAAPTSTIDHSIADGTGIPIEDRPVVESTSIGGVRIAPEGIAIASPAFDVTPARLIAAIVTEQGVHRPDFMRTLPRSAGTRSEA